jgi:hypothetical protein
MRILLITAVALTIGAAIPAHEPARHKEKPAAGKVVKDWKADPACRLVFFAVLQGLYEDGVSDEVVNNIVPPDKKGREKMRHSFVLDCPLCQPAFEAFCVYQSRPRFTDDSKTSTLGKGLPEKTVKGLMSKTLSVRLTTLRTPIRMWVENRLVSMKLDEQERQKWWKDITARVGQGTGTLKHLKGTDPWYKDWAAYWGCAACLGSQDACRDLLRTPAATPKK